MTIEIGLSDFHKIMLAVMKLYCKTPKPNIVTYRHYKHFSNKTFMFHAKNSIIQMTFENTDLEFYHL